MHTLNLNRFPCNGSYIKEFGLKKFTFIAFKTTRSSKKKATMIAKAKTKLIELIYATFPVLLRYGFDI